MKFIEKSIINSYNNYNKNMSQNRIMLIVRKLLNYRWILMTIQSTANNKNSMIQ
jgi:hypothetical protein